MVCMIGVVEGERLLGCGVCMRGMMEGEGGVGVERGGGGACCMLM